MTKVYVPNVVGQDVHAAGEYGEIIVLSVGTQDRFSLSNSHRQFLDALKGSEPDDKLVIVGPASLVALAASILSYKHGKVNYLVFRRGTYQERNITLDQERWGTTKAVASTA